MRKLSAPSTLSVQDILSAFEQHLGGPTEELVRVFGEQADGVVSRKARHIQRSTHSILTGVGGHIHRQAGPHGDVQGRARYLGDLRHADVTHADVKGTCYVRPAAQTAQ